MISGVAFCPQAPVLLPQLAGDAAGDLADLRACCTEALRRVAAAGQLLVLLGGAVQSRSYEAPVSGSLAGFGVAETLWLGRPEDSRAQLPASLTVGAGLASAALGVREQTIAFGIGTDFAGSRAERTLHELAETRDIALLVFADGSARRSTTAPGYFDDRAADFDATVAQALYEGDPTSLRKLDATLGDDLLAAGVRTWHAAAELLAADCYDAWLGYDDAPYGVGYFVATWVPRASGCGSVRD